MSADITRDVNAHAYCDGVAINSFKQALYLAVATAENHDVVGIGEFGHMDVDSNLNPWEILGRTWPRIQTII